MCIMSTKTLCRVLAPRAGSMARCICALLPLLVGCEHGAAPPTPTSASPPAKAEPMPKAFEELYPLFLARKSMSQGEKASLWATQYRNRWVTWEGVIGSFTDHGLTLKHLRATSTFDVSLTCDTATVAALKTRFAVGDRVRYVGSLDSYDDIFRTMYVNHGAVLERVPNGDLGVPADLGRPAP